MNLVGEEKRLVQLVPVAIPKEDTDPPIQAKPVIIRTRVYI